MAILALSGMSVPGRVASRVAVAGGYDAAPHAVRAQEVASRRNGRVVGNRAARDAVRGRDAVSVPLAATTMVGPVVL